MRKKVVCILITVSMLFSACSRSGGDTSQTPEISSDAASTVITEASSSKTTAEIPINTETRIGYVHVSGNKIFDCDGNEFLIKGMAFGNNVWGNPSEPCLTHHNEQSYKELSEMGFNTVRFYLNYGLFESDDSPYEYKEEGFEWLDKNIAWAKKYDIRLILNMHYPQGGYQSQGNGLALWTDSTNQERLTALWKEIAERYVDEPAVIGYGLINEPIVPELGTVEETIGQCYELMQSITDAIRTVDKNHIVFIEHPISVSATEVYDVDWSRYNFETMTGTIKDINAVYEFHFYEPHAFTHQNTDWAGTLGKTMTYNSDMIISDIDNYWVALTPGIAGESTDDWTYFETDFFSETDDYNIGMPVFQGYKLGAGTAYYDDVTVTEYTSEGEPTGNVTYFDFSDKDQSSEFNFWSRDGSGSFGYSPDIGFSGKGAMFISGTADDANLTGSKVILKEGFIYKVSGYVRTVDAPEGFSTSVRCDFAHSSGNYTLNAAYLELKLKAIIDFGKENNVPLYIGEFGTIHQTFIENRGGEQWVSDMLGLLGKYRIGFTYHTYHEPSFGLYTDGTDRLPATINNTLANIFENMLKDI